MKTILESVTEAIVELKGSTRYATGNVADYDMHLAEEIANRYGFHNGEELDNASGAEWANILVDLLTVSAKRKIN